MSADGKVALITGSATGLGAAVAVKFAEQGVRVVINYSKSEQEAHATAAQCADLGVETLIAQGDVAQDDDCRRVVGQTMNAWGRVDMLINNAGTTVFADHADLDALSAEDFLHLYSVNVVGAFQMIRAVTPHMKAAGYGAVVNVSSIAGVMGIGSSVAYAASKGALNTMTKSLARALAPEIRVNAVCPGFIGTRWFKDRIPADSYERFEAGVAKATPLQKAGTPEDIADSVVFMAGDAARHVTGDLLIVDAGQHLGPAPKRRD